MVVPAARRSLRRAITLVLIATAAAPAAASAAELEAKRISLPVRIAADNTRLGSAHLKVTFADAAATARASASIALGANQTYRLTTCLRGYAAGRAHKNRCVARIVTPTAASRAAAPTVKATVPRPRKGKRAWFTYEVVVAELRDGRYATIASSWPAHVARASVGVPAVRSARATTARSLGVPVSGGRTGGVDTNQPDSFCAPVEIPANGAPGPGVSTTGLGTGAPAYYEIGEPTNGRPAKGVMLVVHGGSWFSVGQGGVAAMRADADRWRARGWRTLNVTYRACAQSLGDVQWFYDRARKLWGDALPYCALGASAGGHLALELAASRNGLYCVIAQAGVTDAAGLLAGGEGPRRLYNTMLSAFGPDNLTALSPARNPGALAATRVLYVAATADPVVPAAQGDALQQGIRGANPNAYVDVLGLPDGDVQWVHRAVSSAGLGEYFAREAKLVAPLG